MCDATNAQILNINCRNCDGTGLRVGLPLRNGAAVVCQSCNGTGAESIEIVPFTGKRPMPAVEHVWANTINMPMQPGKWSGGSSYADWAADPSKVHEIGLEIREAACPASWYQAANLSLMPNWEQCQKADQFQQCPMFYQKSQCWARFDLEQEHRPADQHAP